MSEIKKLVAVVLLLTIGCTPPQETEVSMVALIANAGDFDKQRIRTYGFLKQGASMRLYMNREDAHNLNEIQSILIDDMTAAQRQQVAACNNQFISIVGTFRLKNNVLILTDTQRMRGRSRNKYIELVCNYQFN